MNIRYCAMKKTQKRIVVNVYNVYIHCNVQNGEHNTQNIDKIYSDFFAKNAKNTE